ncbi:MAG: HEAT repeat domain-containing protein [Candidatus Acidiferrales bacterium]
MTESKPSATPNACAGMSERLLLYVANELDPQERAAVETHMRDCAACTAAYEREQQLLDWIASAEPAKELDSSGVMLARSRGELGQALDEADQARREQLPWFARLRSFAWLPKIRSAWALHPALSSIVLLGLGFALGVGVPEWVRVNSSPAPGRPAVVVNAAPRISEQALQNVGSVGLNWETPEGSSSPRVQLQLNSDNPMHVEGSPDDADVERVLTFVVANGQRFDPGVLLDSVDLLTTRVSDPSVRRALCVAARKDPNPGVRLKAIEGLRGYARDAQVQQALLDALSHDDNSGVRIEAVNALNIALSSVGEEGGGSTSAVNPRVVQVLRHSAQNDTNHYVRMTATSALQQIAANDATRPAP